MPLQFYKPNQANTGHACSFSFNSKDHALFVNFIKQTGPKSFKGGKTCSVKFSVYEIGALMDTIERGRESKGYHRLPNGSQIIQFRFAPSYVGEGESRTFKGYGLSVTRESVEDSSAGKEKFGLGFTAGEAVTLREYLRYSMKHIFDAIYSTDKQARAGAAEKKEAPKKAAPKAAKNSEPVEKEPDPFEDDPFEESQPSDAIESDTPEKTDETPSPDENAHPKDDIF